VLRCVAVCCNMLQCIADVINTGAVASSREHSHLEPSLNTLAAYNHFSEAVAAQVCKCFTLQHTGANCNTLQHTATHCNTLQHTATHYKSLQHTAIRCNTLQHDATYCNTLQHVATHLLKCLNPLLGGCGCTGVQV